MTIYKIRAGRITTVPATEHVGEKGQIFYDEDTGELRLSDGETPGGISITSGGGGTGPRGATGTAATITVGTVTVSTTTASVTNVGTTSSAILNFVLQQGPQGIQGPIGNTGTQGIQGPIGATGTAATITIGTISVSTTTATVTNVGTSGTAIFNFVLQQGPQGIKGDTGLPGADGSFGGAAFEFTYNTDIASTEPPTGAIEFNSLTFSAATELYINYYDKLGAYIYNFLQTIDDSTSAIKGHFTVAEKTNLTNLAMFSIIGSHIEAGGPPRDHFIVPIAYLSGSLSIANSSTVVVTFARTGDAGDQGPAGTIAIGNVTTGAAGSNVDVTNTGTASAAVLNFTIPQGIKGDTGNTGTQGPQGATGTAATITIGEVTVSTSTATVTNVGTSDAAILNFVLQQGIKGDTGNTGTQGATGTAATITVGEITISTSTSTVTNVGTSDAAILNFVLQQGPQGPQGPIGNTGTQGPIGTTGTAATITIGEVTVSTSTATVTNVGTTSSAILNFVLQQGPQGIKGDTGNTGDTGTAATVTVGTITISTTTASVTNVGTTSSAILNFVLQQGPQGEIGLTGPPGQNSSLYNYQARTNIQSGDPGNGKIIWNNATQQSATALHFSHIDGNNDDIDYLLAFILPDDVIRLQDQSNSTQYQDWTVSGSVTEVSNSYVIVPVTLSTSTFSFSNDEQIIAILKSAGVVGPPGLTGAKGDTGTAATITVGEVTVSTSTATVTNVGTTSSAILNFVLQQGPQGIKGDTGNTGTQGATGTAATITVGTVTVSTTTASVTNVGTSGEAILNFVLQQGPSGTTGGGGGGAGQFTPAVYTTATIATAIIDVNNIDQYNITSLATDVTFSVSSAVTPDDGQRLLIRIRSDATPRNLTWTQTANQFRTIGISFPTITSASKLVYIGCVYNAVDGFWDLISSLQQP